MLHGLKEDLEQTEFAGLQFGERADDADKGINLPGAKLRINPITRRDLQIVDFALKHGIHVFGLSFVESAKDIDKVRQFAKKKG